MVTREQNSQLNALDRRLFHSYRQAATTAVQNHERAIRRLQREAATADEERLRYLTWQVERTGGLADNITIEIANAGETARRMIERENLNMFQGGYRDIVLGINRQLGQAGISTNMQMMNRDAINAIFNGDNAALGQLPGYRGAFEQVVVLDRQRGNTYYRMATGELVETRTIIGKLRNELVQAITLGEGIPQITRRIINVSCGTAQTAKGKRAEARRIARTETIRALNQGKHLAALQVAEEYDIPMKKKWLSAADERTRTTPPDEFDHAKMNGVTVGLEEPFIVGGEELQYPGDPNGSAANTIHCRCTTVNVVDIDALRQQRLDAERESGIMNSYGDTPEIATERQKILDGIYLSRVTNAQRKHIEGTREFEQKREQMERLSPGSMPARLNDGVDAQSLVDRYKGTGRIYFNPPNNPYPREEIIADTVVGRTWVKSLGRYVDTRVFEIMYSGKGVHIVPMNERGRT